MLSYEVIQKYCDVLLWGVKKARGSRIKSGEPFLIRFDMSAFSIVEHLYIRLLKERLNPVLRLMPSPTMERSFFEIANLGQLQFIPPGEKELFSNLGGGIYILAPESLTHLEGVDPKRIATTLLARKALKNILDRRENKRLFGWTLTLLPTQELANRAGTDIETYKDQVIKACFLDEDDPVGKWEEIFGMAHEIKEWLNKMGILELEVESKNIQLRLPFGPTRRWVGISGHNIPSFELFYSPDWRYVEGRYFANLPSYRNGNYVEGVSVIFKEGKVIEASAKKGEPFLIGQLDTDKGSRMVGEFSLTDKRFSRINRFMANTLYDENYGGEYGNCHLALGASYLETYNGNKSRLDKRAQKKLGFNDSALHWDLINTEEKAVYAKLSDGSRKLIYEKGSFMY
ncbi:MAG: aminopeptidase [Desulfatiglandales bacterium]